MQAPITSMILHEPGMPHFLNAGMMAPNVLEIDIPQDLINELAPFAHETRVMEQPGERYALSNGVCLYNMRPLGWNSDICWLSHADERSWEWFDAVYRRLRLGALVAPYVPHDREVRLYAGFFVTRRTCQALDMHCDWSTQDNLAFTLMLPLTSNAPDLGLTYETVRGERRQHTYRAGKGLVFGSKFLHSTAVGELDERAVFLSFTFGTDRMDQWGKIGATTARQCDILCQPDGTFITQAEWNARYGKADGY